MKKLSLLFATAIVLFANAITVNAQCFQTMVVSAPTVTGDVVSLSGYGQSPNGSAYGSQAKIGKNLRKAIWQTVSHTDTPNSCTVWNDIVNANQSDYAPGTIIRYRVYMELSDGSTVYSDSVDYTIPKSGGHHSLRPAGTDNAPIFFSEAENSITTKTTLRLKASADDEEMESEVSVYPNPIVDKATFSLDGTGAQLILIYNETGDKVSQISVSEGASEVTFEKGNLATGFYLYQIICSDGSQISGKMLIK
jgi:hypothetical protein